MAYINAKARERAARERAEQEEAARRGKTMSHAEWLAKKRLRESADSVTRIAAELGFLDTSYFVRVFKKFEGITPTDYRRNRHP